VKRVIQESTLEESKALLNKVMTFSSAPEIREFVNSYMHERFPDEFQINGA
jgi:phosphotransferase system enzyme I (PtsI)